MSKPITWTQIKNQLKNARQEVFLTLLKELWDLSPQNKAFLRSHVFPQNGDPELLEKTRKKVVHLIYPDFTNFPKEPKLGESRKAILAYKKATSDIKGSLDLMLLHIEKVLEFIDDFGAEEETFYNSALSMLENAFELLFNEDPAKEFLNLYKTRLLKIELITRNMYSDLNIEIEDMLGRLGLDAAEWL